MRVSGEIVKLQQCPGSLLIMLFHLFNIPVAREGMKSVHVINDVVDQLSSLLIKLVGLQWEWTKSRFCGFASAPSPQIFAPHPPLRQIRTSRLDGKCVDTD